MLTGQYGNVAVYQLVCSADPSGEALLIFIIPSTSLRAFLFTAALFAFLLRLRTGLFASPEKRKPIRDNTPT